MKWISKGKKKKYSMKRFIKGFKHAFNGLIGAFKTEQNLLIELIVGLLLVGLGIYLKVSMVELCVIILGIGVTISLELLNTSIEYAVDMAMPEVHPLAKIAKDIGEASVLVMSLITFIVTLIIYIPKIF